MYSLLRLLLGKTKKYAAPDKHTHNPTDSSSRCALEIEMNNDGTINIICSWPEFDEMNKDKMIGIANNYALMIDAINQGYLSKEIIATIRNYKGDNAYDTLFAQNVFYKIAELNYIKNTTTESDKPLVRPTSVFKNLQ